MADIVLVGPQRLVNQTTAGGQSRPDVAFLNDGRAVFVWQNQANDAVYARVADGRGAWATGEFAITSANSESPLVAADTANTGFIVGWQTPGMNFSTVLTQYFTEANTPRAGPVTVAGPGYSAGSGTVFGLSELAGRAGGALVGLQSTTYGRFGGQTSTEQVVLSSPNGGDYVTWASGVRDASVSEAINTQGLVWIGGYGGPNGGAVAKQSVNTGAVVERYELGVGADGVVAALPGGKAAVAWVEGGQILFSIAGGATGILTANNGAGGSRSDPAVAGLADGRFVIGWTDSSILGDTNVHGRVFNADGTPATGEFVFGGLTDGNQSDLQFAASRYGGFVATWTSNGLASGDGNDASVQALFYEVLDYRQERFAGADTVVGTSRADSLSGGAGDDVLYGGPGWDILAGGTGADKFLLTTDGSIDRMTDFNAAEGDHLLVLDANGAIVDGSRGILVWDQDWNAISWDPDSDAGPLSRVEIAAAFGAEGQLNRANLAAGFQPSAIRVIDAGRGKVETVLDWSGQAFDRTVATYDAAGRLTGHDIYYDSGAYSNRWFNEPSTAMRYAEYDAQNRLTVYATQTYGDLRTTYTFDPGGVQAYSREVYEFAPGDALKYYGVVYDSGARSERFFDYDNTKTYSHIIEDYDATGRLLGRATYGDDGSVILG
jgi:hypothetical protein